SIRHYMTDWIGLARAQERMSAYQKELREATLANNQTKLNKLQEAQPEIMKMQSITMISSIKPAIFTMIIFVIVFPWLWAVYIPSLENPPAIGTISLPWTAKWPLNEPLGFCPGPSGYWIILYFILSLPFGLLFQHGLKMLSYSRKIHTSEELQYSETSKAMENAELRIEAAKDLGVRVTKPNDLLKTAQTSLEAKDYFKARNLIKEAEEDVDRQSVTHKKTEELLKSAETMIKVSESKGVGVKEARKALESGKKALVKSDYTTAIYFAKQSKRKVKDAKEQHKDAQEMLSSVKATMYDMKELKTSKAENLLKKAEKALKDHSYDKVMEHLRDSKHEADDVKQQHQKASEELESARAAIESANYQGLKITKAEELYTRAEKKLEAHNYSEALNYATQSREIAEQEKTKFQEASEAVNFAKLIISNAKTFGASVIEAENLLGNAEEALKNKNYAVAISNATRAKDIAEQAKRAQQRSSRRGY
ncbi:MAG: DUF106 domain-containing protein, partial [Thermoplasmata archaeon]|nr:DUF106 domain-containing protein [Thermoplasmata archaeon]